MASLKWLKHKKRWQVRWHITCADGGLSKGSSTFRHKRDAFEFRQKKEQEADRLRSGLITRGESVTVAIKKWKLHIRRHTDRTQEHYRYAIGCFINSLSVSDVRQINKSHIERYINIMLDDGKTNRTVNAHLTPIKAFCRWYSEPLGIANPAVQCKILKEEPPNARHLTRVEYEAIIAKAESPLRERLQFLGNTGLRATEFSELTWSCVNHDLTSLTITGKGRKRRSIPLNSICREILQTLKPAKPNPSAYIFLSKIKTAINRNVLYESCALLAKKVKIKQFGPHAIRHYFGSELLLAGVDIAIVSKILGHSSIRITEQTYIHILPEHLAGVTEALVGDYNAPCKTSPGPPSAIL